MGSSDDSSSVTFGFLLSLSVSESVSVSLSLEELVLEVAFSVWK